MKNITLITLFISIVTLLIVGYQTWCTKKALAVAENSIKLTKTAKQLEGLEEMYHVINVMYFLNRWKEELEEVLLILKKIKSGKDAQLSKQEVKPQGLIEEWAYEEMPSWLSVIYSSGAQYYFSASSNYKCLSSKKKIQDPEIFIQKFEKSIASLKTLQKYIDDQVPQVFLDCPASLSTRDFFKENSA